METHCSTKMHWLQLVSDLLLTRLATDSFRSHWVEATFLSILDSLACIQLDQKSICRLCQLRDQSPRPTCDLRLGGFFRTWGFSLSKFVFSQSDRSEYRSRLKRKCSLRNLLPRSSRPHLRSICTRQASQSSLFDKASCKRGSSRLRRVAT